MNLTSATATFSEALSCLYYALQLLDLLPQRNDSPYSEPAFRHALRMRPFLPISIPTVPPANFFPDELSSILPSNLLKSPSSTKKYIATALLKRADDCILAARGTWDAVSKADANTAQCVGCEVKWRARMKNILRSVIAAGISVAGVKKWVHDGMKNGEVKIEVLIGDKTYHEWWVIPKVIKQRGEKPLKK